MATTVYEKEISLAERGTKPEQGAVNIVKSISMVLAQPSINTARIVASEITLQAFVSRNNALVEIHAP